MSRTRSIFAGVGSYIPPRRVGAGEFLDRQFYLDYRDAVDAAETPSIVRKFEEITGIRERRWVDDDLVTSDLALFSAREALASSDVDPETLDYLIVAHNFGDVKSDNPRSDLVPTLAARVKQRLAIRNPRCVAYDLPFGCAGWLQAVIQADYFLKSGDARRALVIGAETLSRVSDPHDRDSMLYSDGAGAVILEAREQNGSAGILAHCTRCDTLEHASLMWMGPSFNGSGNGGLFLKMHGRKLYEYAVTVVPELVLESLDRAGVPLGEVKRVLVHQANGKMNQSILRRLLKLGGVDEAHEELMPMTVSLLGNSSVATLPTLLDLVVRGRVEGEGLASGDVLVLVSVGAGMNVCSVVYRWP
ncbi:MAG: ketoacyl-ACP synthase III [Thermoanaerobaculia bacterium]|nr:ketoacyl-ACP synthase III [Thermoanaerobaculia bacterium]